MMFIRVEMRLSVLCKCIFVLYIPFVKGGAVAPDPEVEVRAPLGSPCCVLEQDIFTPKKVLVIPRKQWRRPNMTENCLPGRQASNQTKQNQKTICKKPFHIII